MNTNWSETKLYLCISIDTNICKNQAQKAGQKCNWNAMVSSNLIINLTLVSNWDDSICSFSFCLHSFSFHSWFIKSKWVRSSYYFIDFRKGLSWLFMLHIKTCTVRFLTFFINKNTIVFNESSLKWKQGGTPIGVFVLISIKNVYNWN